MAVNMILPGLPTWVTGGCSGILKNYNQGPAQVEETRDIWLFSLYLAGIRISDVLRMKWKDCIDGRLVYRMGKNSKIVSLKCPIKQQLFWIDIARTC
jgi:hypothetical protein